MTHYETGSSGLTSESIQKRLLSESELRFRKAVKLKISMETAAKDSVALRNKGGPEVHRMTTRPGTTPSRSSGAQNDGNYRGLVSDAEENPTLILVISSMRRVITVT